MFLFPPRVCSVTVGGREKVTQNSHNLPPIDEDDTQDRNTHIESLDIYLLLRRKNILTLLHTSGL